MKILLGTSNPSKAQRFRDLLAGYDVECLTLEDLSIRVTPMETGRDPVENAVVKAKFYSRYFDRVVCGDSGLYFMDLPMDDPRQPGLRIRRPKGMILRDDESMIAYYASLVRTLGGRVRCNYVDGMAVWVNGQLHTLLDDREEGAFFMVDAVHPKRHPGWPLDSISVDPVTNLYYVDPAAHAGSPAAESDHRQRLTEFLVRWLGLEKKP